MKLSSAVKPISYIKAHAAEVIREIAATQGTVIITQKGEATAVLQDIHTYEQLQESLAMLKLAVHGQQEIRAGQVKPVAESFRRVRARIKSERQR